jgi:hypothetical protein
MKNAYQVIVKANQGSAKSTTQEVPEPGSWWGALKIKAIPGARYQLIDKGTSQGPDNIRVKRVGNDLRISFEGRDEADLVITDYYEYTAPGFGAVIGETDPGVYYAYTPESGQTSALMDNLPDGASNIGMALGGERVVASGAAAGALVAVAGFNPLLAAPLALVGAGGGGGGGGGTTDGTGTDPGTGGTKPDTTPPKISAARLAPEDDTGVSNSDGITSDNTPRLLIDADPDAVSATVIINGKTYTSTEKINGQFVVQIPDVDALGNGAHEYTVEVKDAAGNPSQRVTGSLTVLTDVKPPAHLLFKNLKLTEDSGVPNDFLTNKQALQFSGEVDWFDSFTQRFLVQVLNDTGGVLSMAYVSPDVEGHWAFDNSALVLLGKDNETTPYLIKTSVVDLAGNILTSTSQSFVVDLENPSLKYVAGAGSSGSSERQDFGDVSFHASEQGFFASGVFMTINTSVALSRNTFEAGTFVLNFTDLAGNVSASLTNAGQAWSFKNLTVPLNQGVSAGAVIDRMGSVGKYALDSGLDTLDLASLYDKVPSVGKKAAINHISAAGGGPDTITISMEDVLALGVKNSFTTSGKLQMRIDRDAEDRIFLDNKLGGSSALHWTLQAAQTSLGGTPYSVYSNDLLSLELFIQQGIPVSAVL